MIRVEIDEFRIFTELGNDAAEKRPSWHVFLFVS